MDLIKKIEYLQREVQELRGKVEEQSHTISQMQDAQKKLYVDLDSRISGSSSKSPTAGIDLDDKELDLDSHALNTQNKLLPGGYWILGFGNGGAKVGNLLFAIFDVPPFDYFHDGRSNFSPVSETSETGRKPCWACSKIWPLAF